MDDLPIHMLLVEDSPTDVLLIQEALADAPAMRIAVRSCARLSEALEHLHARRLDVVLLDLGLPDSQGLDTLVRVQRQDPRTPIVVLTGLDDETVALQAMHEGAQDYLVKGQITGSVLARAIRYAIERKRAEAALRQSEERFRLIVDTALDAVITIDAQGTITGWNRQAEQIFGWSHHEIIGKTLVATIIPERYRQAHQRGLQQFLATGEGPVLNKRIEIEALHRAGHEFPIELTITPLQSGEVYTFSAFVRDITDRKQAEEAIHRLTDELEQRVTERTAQLAVANRALAQANRAKDRFLASMSHELRTPLNAIIGFTGTLLMGLPGPLTTDQEKHLQTVRKSAEHLLALINDILDLAKIEAGAVTIQREMLACQQLIAETVATLRPLAEAKGLQLDVTLPSQDLVVSTDRRALSQILINLLNNAIKFTERGEVLLALSEREEHGQRLIEMRVSDTGIGIRPEDQAHLFQAFTQVEGAHARRQEGTGLGLHLSLQLATLLGGQITVQSEEGRGSTFTLSIPER
jgi:PAS domain S-box-containing protein